MFELLYKDAKVVRAGLIYVEDSSRNYVLELCEEDNKLIEAKVKSVYENIYNMKFDCPEKTENTCQYCKYQQLCNLNLF
jgi:CRISPR/Cas system-associated exonuclease Cas4 (RecB family)